MNSVHLIGRVGQEPTVREFENGAIATLALATTERGYKLQNGTEVPERTDWHNLVFHKGLANIVKNYVHKGAKLFVGGKILNRTYEKDGVKHTVTEIYVSEMELLDGKQQTQQQPQQQRAVSPTPPPPVSNQGHAANSDDLPF